MRYHFILPRITLHVITHSKKKTPLTSQCDASTPTTQLHITLLGVSFGALQWDKWSWHQSGGSGGTSLPVLRLTWGARWPKRQDLDWRPDIGGNGLILILSASCSTTRPLVKICDHVNWNKKWSVWDYFATYVGYTKMTNKKSPSWIIFSSRNHSFCHVSAFHSSR